MQAKTTEMCSTTKIYDSLLVAEFLRAKGFEKNFEIRTPKIQKILYMIYGHWLAKFNSPPFDEQPRAWPSGPIFPNLEGQRSLTQFQSVNDPKFDELKKDKTLVFNIEAAIRHYLKYSDDDFGWWLRTEKAPWKKTTMQRDFMWNDVISDAFIRSYFSIFQRKSYD